MKPQHIEDWLAQLGQPSADRDYKPGHERMLALLKPLHLTQPKLRIRIAGTNGKGSTAFMLAAALQAAGLKVGLYTSPHILSFNERIRINLKAISDQNLFELMQTIMPIALDVGASYFEVATALAFKHFSHAGIDVEILEAGVGARLDATTAVTADMALITPIGLDHQNWLGDDLMSIASEKSYALKYCSWGLSAAQEPEVSQILKQFYPNLQEVTCHTELVCHMPGRHQQANASLVIAALDTLLDEKIISANPQLLYKAACAAIAPGRLQYIAYEQAHIWLDAAHNRHAVEALLPSLRQLADPFDAILIYTREDRSLLDCLELLRPYSQTIISDAPKHADIYAANPSIALEKVLSCKPTGKILLLGSFTSVATAMKYLTHGNHSAHP